MKEKTLLSAQWKKASKCRQATCVEARFNGNRVQVRNSDSPETVIEFTQAEWDAFIAGAEDGEFDL